MFFLFSFICTYNFYVDQKKFARYKAVSKNKYKKEETIIFQDTDSTSDEYICVGKTNLDECKLEIENVDSIAGVTWSWAENLDEIGSTNIKRIYITDTQNSDYFYTSAEIILTKSADLTIGMGNIIIKHNGLENLIAQSSTAKLTVIALDNYDHKFKAKYEAAPTEIDFKLLFNKETIEMTIQIPNDYEKNSIKIEGSCTISVRNYVLSKMDVFTKPDTITFVENTNNNYDSLCLADTIEKCINIDEDYKQVTSFDEALNYKIDHEKPIYIFKPVIASIDTYIEDRTILIFEQGSSFTLNDVHDNVRILYYLSDDNYVIGINNQNYKSILAYIYDQSVNIILNVKNLVYLDALAQTSNQYVPNLELKTESNNIEIIPCIGFNSVIHNIDPNYKIKIAKDLSISSPLPEYLDLIFDVQTITCSSICVYLNEDGKSLCGSKTSKSFTEVQTEEIDNKNIVIVTGIDARFSIPAAWTNEHNLYFIKTDSVEIVLSDISTLTYYSNGLKINDKNTIRVGNVKINVPAKLTLNVDMNKVTNVPSYMYNCYLDCGSNDQTELFKGYFIFGEGNQPCINIGGYDQTHVLNILINTEEDESLITNLISFDGQSEGLHFSIGGFQYICYASNKEKCTKPNYFLVSDVSTLVKAITSFPDFTVFVTENLVIPELIGKSFTLDASNENIEVKITSPPKSFETLEDGGILFNYDDSLFIKTLNKMNIVVDIENELELSVSNALQSKLTFNLKSNVFVSTQSKITQDCTIQVVKNGFHLFTSSLENFGNIFGDNIEKYNVICAYEANAESLCTFNEKDTIENVFKLPFNYNEVEIAISSNSKKITLPEISESVNIIIRSDDTKNLIINSASSIQMTKEKVLINQYWNINPNSNSFTVKLKKQSSLSIPEKISTLITLQLSDSDSIIDLKDCVKHDKPLITLSKFGNQNNVITVLGTTDIIDNFKSLLVSYEGITFENNDSKKYLCICKDDSCNKCKEGIDGIITNSDSLSSDPGDNVEIRIFMTVEVASIIFTNEHNVVIDSTNKLFLNNVENVYQNIEGKLKVDNLIFSNGNNLIIKPKSSALSITMSKQKAGPEFTIELSNYLVLKVSNAQEEGIIPSKIIVNGNGELNLYDYPSDKVEAASTIKVIKGIYIVCNSQTNGGSFCSYQSLYNDYKIIESFDSFANTFDKDSKILVILDSYTSNIDVDINKLNHQQLMFIKAGSTTKLLESNTKVRFLSTNVITNNADKKTNLDGSDGGVVLSNDDSESYIVGFNDKLIIKQEGVIENDLKPIVIQPQSSTASIIIDKSVNINKQQIKIETEKETLDLTVFVGDKSIDDVRMSEFLDYSKDKVNANYKEGEPEKEKEPPKKDGLKPGEIAGIVIGVVAFVAIVIVVVIFVIKKKKNNNNSSSEVSEQ